MLCKSYFADMQPHRNYPTLLVTDLLYAKFWVEIYFIPLALLPTYSILVHACVSVYTLLAAPAIVTPGENTTTEVEEDGFRFFQSECPAFSMTIMIEQIDLVGTCSLYASTSIQNPGTLLT